MEPDPDDQSKMPPEVEASPKIKDIPSNAHVEHHHSCLHIWTRDHPPSQIIGSPSTAIQTRSSDDLTKHCHFATFMS